MAHRYPRTLSSGMNNTVIAISETEVGKIFSGDTRSDIGSEAEKMKFANSVNDLIVKFCRIEISETNNYEMLVMERLFPMDFRAFEIEKRELWFNVFEHDISMLHQKGFVHHDIQRPSNIGGERYDNVFLTQNGLRLIDVGISAMQKHIGDSLFDRYVEQEIKELEQFRIHFLSR